MEKQCFQSLARDSTTRSVHLLVSQSISRSVCHTLIFWRFLAVLSLLLRPNCLVGLFHHCPCPPARDLASRVSGLVHSASASLKIMDCGSKPNYNILKDIGGGKRSFPIQYLRNNARQHLLETISPDRRAFASQVPSVPHVEATLNFDPFAIVLSIAQTLIRSFSPNFAFLERRHLSLALFCFPLFFCNEIQKRGLVG